MVSLETARIFNSSSCVKFDKGPNRMLEELKIPFKNQLVEVLVKGPK